LPLENFSEDGVASTWHDPIIIDGLLKIKISKCLQLKLSSPVNQFSLLASTF